MVKQSFISFGLIAFILCLVAMPAFAETAKEVRENRLKAKNTVDIACVGTAIDKRETALIAGLNTLNTNVVKALQDRQTALKNAWAKTDVKERRTAIRTAWKDHKTSREAAQKTWRSAKKSAWDTFTTEAKACGSKSADDNGTSGQDAQL